MRGKLIFITIGVIIFLLAWQYLPALSVYNQSIVPEFESSKHKKYDDMEGSSPPLGYDSDGDGLLDFDEDFNNNGIQDTNLGETDRFDPDSDDDGLLDGDEYNWWMQRYTDQKNIGKIPDWVKTIHPNLNEQQLFDLYKPTGDLDGDGLANILDFDSDNDGWSDGYEVNEVGTDPANPDHDGDSVPDSEDQNPFSNRDSDGDGIPDDWEKANDLDPDDPTDALEDPDQDNWTNREEYEHGTNPHHPNGKQNKFNYNYLDINHFYEIELDRELFRVSPEENPKYWRLTAFDNYNGKNWSRSNTQLTRYESTILPEVSIYTSSESPTYNIEFHGSASGYMPTALHTTNIFDLEIDSISQPSYGPNYMPDAYYDSEMGYVINVDMYGYSFATIDYKYSNSQLKNATATSGDTFDRYLTLSANLKSKEKTALESIAQMITINATNDFEKVTKIIKYLQNHYYYNLNYNHSYNDDQDYVYQFLFDNPTKEGICAHFTSAFVLLSRLNDLPTRFVTGFALGELVPIYNTTNSSGDWIGESEPEYIRVVREGHKHTWGEVRFEGIGWLPFEVTGYSRSGTIGGTGVDSNGEYDTVYKAKGEPGGGGGGTSMQPRL